MRVDSDPRVPIVSDDVNLDPHRLVLVGVLCAPVFVLGRRLDLRVQKRSFQLQLWEVERTSLPSTLR
jgi:hypothetical protein